MASGEAHGGHRGSLAAWSLGIGVIAAVISLGRLWLGNPSAPLDVLWAEDGVFPLCVVKESFIGCLVDPFAGYLLLVPRLLAGVVSLVPVQSWALVTNVLAALLAGTCSALAFAWLRRFGIGGIAAGAAALVPVIAPISGLEAINALGSSYMLLLFLATIVIAFQHRTSVQRWPGAVLIGLLLLVTGLTIPLGVILIAAIAVQVVRRRIRPRFATLWSGLLAITLVAQLVVAQGAAKPRAVAVTADSIGSYFSFLPRSLLTYWPGLTVTSFDYDVNFTITPVSFTGWLVAAGLAVGGLVLLARRTDRSVAAGILVLASLLFGFVPTAIGWANNRYFVTPAWLCAVALIVLLERPVRAWAWGRLPRMIALVVGVAVVLVIWWPLMPASWFRSTPQPPWRAEVDRVIAHCKTDPGLVERPIVSPFWPPDWGDALSEPTHPNLPCVIAFRWE